MTARLELHAVGKSFGTKTVLRRASLTVAAGERVAVLGGNGTGKSTLLAIAAGVLDPDEGKVTRPAGPNALGYAPDKPDMPEHLLVVEWLALVASLKKTRPEPSVLDIEPLLGRRIAALSLGQRQRVSLVAAWMGEPAILVLDEPTNGLDASSREAVLAHLRTRTALVATHDPDVVRAMDARVVTVERHALR